MAVRRRWRLWALVGLMALAGCRGCGCEAPSPADGAEGGVADGASLADASPAQTMGPAEVDRAITEGLRAIAARDNRTAIARFEAAATADPGRRVPQQRLCGLYRDAGRTADALRACRAWRELEPEPDFQARADAIIEQLRGAAPGDADP